MTAQLPSRWKLKKIIETADQIIAEMAKSSSIDEWAFLNDDMGTPSEVKALAEFAMAAHEQEPVSFDELRAAVFEMTGGRPTEWSDSTYKGHQVVPFINFNSLARIVEKFRTHPAPVPAVPDEMISELLAIAKKAAEEADECSHAEFSDDSMEHTTAIAEWERRAAMLNGGKS